MFRRHRVCALAPFACLVCCPGRRRRRDRLAHRAAPPRRHPAHHRAHRRRRSAIRRRSTCRRCCAARPASRWRRTAASARCSRRSRCAAAPARRTLVLVDGVRIEDAGFSSTALQHIMLDQVERVEIVRGNVSSLYGSNAVGGVIQVFTKRGQGEPAPYGAGHGRLAQYHATCTPATAASSAIPASTSRRRASIPRASRRSIRRLRRSPIPTRTAIATRASRSAPRTA